MGLKYEIRQLVLQKKAKKVCKNKVNFKEKNLVTPARSLDCHPAHHYPSRLS
jgi:hypothetical protein